MLTFLVFHLLTLYTLYSLSFPFLLVVHKTPTHMSSANANLDVRIFTLLCPLELVSGRKCLLIRKVKRAVAIVQKAVEEDSKKNYAEAYRQYQNALDYFMLALKCLFVISILSCCDLIGFADVFMVLNISAFVSGYGWI